MKANKNDIKVKKLARCGNEVIVQKNNEYFWIIADNEGWNDKNHVNYVYHKFVGDNVKELVDEVCRCMNNAVINCYDDDYDYDDARAKYTEWQNEIDGSRESFVKWCKE